MLNYLSLYQDADFSIARFEHVYNADFANTLGNLVSRLAALARKFSFECYQSERSRQAETTDTYDLAGLSQLLWQRIQRINSEINETQPWARSEGDARELLARWISELHVIAGRLRVLLPGTGDRLLALLDQGVHNSTTPLFPRR